MKRSLRAAALLAAAVSLGGCIVSLHPLYFEKNLVFEPALLGSWSQPEKKDRWEFRKTGEHEYELLYSNNGGAARFFEFRLLRLDGILFADIYPKRADLGNDLLQLHMIPGHGFVRVEFSPGELKLSWPDFDWFKSRLAERKLGVAHESVDSGVILTAPTAQLQKYALRWAKIPGAFSGPALLKKL